MNQSIRASCLGWIQLALTPALSPGRGGIVVRFFETTTTVLIPGSNMQIVFRRIAGYCQWIE